MSIISHANLQTNKTNDSNDLKISQKNEKVLSIQSYSEKAMKILIKRIPFMTDFFCGGLAGLISGIFVAPA
jgi:hypothetical protein